MENKELFINNTKKKEEVHRLIRQRLDEFSAFENKSNEDWFSELCFCLLTANASAKGGIKVQEAVGKAPVSAH